MYFEEAETIRMYICLFSFFFYVYLLMIVFIFIFQNVTKNP